MSEDVDSAAGWDFFISYTKADQRWAEWVAWQLEAADYRVLIQAWDFVPGSDWRVKMEQGISRATRTIAVLSHAYLSSVYGGEEWRAARAADPEGLARKLLPVRVEECDRPGVLRTVVSVDLFDVAADVARRRLLDGIRGALDGRVKPDVEPEFPVHPRPAPPPVEPPAFPDQMPIPQHPQPLATLTGRGKSVAFAADGPHSPVTPDAPPAAVDRLSWAAASTAPPQDFSGIAAVGLFAAGVTAMLSRRRSGLTQPPPSAEERALLLAADTAAARFVDQSLRVLSASLTDQGRLLPPVYAAILTDEALILHMAPAEEEPPPAPWEASEIPGAWRIERRFAPLEGLDGGRFTGLPAPFPGLVSFGHTDGGARILIDLEGAPGVISLLGDPTMATQVAIAAVLELATNAWSDDLRVCLIGFPVDELLAIAPERLWTAASVAAALDVLFGRNKDSPLEMGRRIAGNRGALAPVLLVLSAPPNKADAARLARMASGRRHAVGVLVVGDTPTTRWRFTVGPDRRMSLGPLNVEVWPQTITRAEYRAIANLFREADSGLSALARGRHQQ
ncbi:toll/interleukin-1 receptor domain-containing protein [Frankia gtarii]|uniref:toll/interleukin-1 receptor domain-containing protein n=1 Tax=Frankia gtarii TaxID=2950102 RepID=UPI0021C14F6E|nr:toll/interleukin-1 receptor domain-containing protein [Frankia gtarii]